MYFLWGSFPFADRMFLSDRKTARFAVHAKIIFDRGKVDHTPELHNHMLVQ